MTDRFEPDAALGPLMPEERLPEPSPAIDGCPCICHRQPGIVHFMACCGVGSIREKLKGLDPQ